MIKDIPILVSNSHAHLSSQTAIKLFGDYGRKCKCVKKLTQPGQFVSNLLIDLSYRGKVVNKLVVVGPYRENDIIELCARDIDSFVDPFHYNLQDFEISTSIKNIPLIDSNSLKIMERHIHISENMARECQITSNMTCAVEIQGNRGLVFQNVLIKISPCARFEMHLSCEEAIAAGIYKYGKGIMIYE